MKNKFYIVLFVICLLPMRLQAENVYDDKQSESYTQTWQDGAPLSQAQFKAWVALAATSVFDFSYDNYEERKQENKKFFTTLGHPSFYNALEAAHMHEMITKNKQRVSGYLLAIPRIHPPILKNERYQWNVDLVYSVAYESENAITTQKLRVFMTVAEKKKAREIPIDDDLTPLSLIGIRNWIAEPMKDGTFVCEETQAKADQLNQEQLDRLNKLEEDNISLQERIERLTKYIRAIQKR